MADNQMPQPNPKLQTLKPMIGSWELHGRTEGVTEDNIKGKAVISELPGGFFYKQEIEMDFAGMFQVKGTEIIGYNAEEDALTSLVYSNMAPMPVAYHWELVGNNLMIHMDIGATMHATMSDDGKEFSGKWQPDAGHENDPGNVAYTFGGHRL
jgi:hypothetical protein